MDKESILQNLKDAGCEPVLIDKIIYFIFSAQHLKALNLLAKHKIRLLENLHQSQKKIDCLDFLIFNLKQKT